VALVSTAEILRLLEVDGTNMFNLLNEVEDHSYRAFARENYEPLTPIPEIWHPVVRDECRIINEEAETTLEEYMRER
jgi:alpha-ketoglutarate-dependent taurine dioxygenase